MRSKIFPYTLILLLALALAWMWFDKESGHDQETHKTEELYKDSILSIRASYDEIIRQKDSAAYQIFKRSEEGGNRAREEAIYWKGQFQKEKQRNRSFTSTQTDSLLSLVK